MFRKINIAAFLILMGIAVLVFPLNAIPQTLPLPDEQATFGLTQPDVIILMDVTGTMMKGPTGTSSTYVYASTADCTADTTNCNGSGCLDGYCSSSSGKITTTCTYNCSRLGISKRAIFSVLDYNKDGEITTVDSGSLNVRVGAGSFGRPDVSSNLQSGYQNISSVDVSTDTYQKTVCGSKNKNDVCNAAKVKSNACFTNPCVAGQPIRAGGTALVGSLDAVLAQYATVNSGDNAKSCREKFILLITDGADNLQCGSAGDCDDYDDMYCRRQLVLEAKKIANTSAITGSPNYKLFVIGFGMGMPDYLKNTLNWMAFWGDPANTEANNPSAAIKPSNLGTLGTCSLLPGETTADIIPGSCQTSVGGWTTVTKFYGTNNDPGNQTLSGYAYITETASDFTAALQSAITAIAESTYSFTKASVQPVRDADENYLYEASFNYVSTDPFWIGHLQRFGICTDAEVGSVAGCTAVGDIKTNYDWDAGVVLRTAVAADRKIYTYKGGSQVAFKTPTDGGTITAADLEADNDTSRDAIVNFIRGGDTAYDSTSTIGGFFVDGWKLGDVFHASPITISTPPEAFTDKWDTQSKTSKGYYLHRADHPRTTADGTRLLLLGANDGQLHLIKTSNGSEVWSFIPPNLLPRLRYIAHDTHPVASNTYMTGLARGHQYLVDGPVSAQEIWIDSNTTKGTLCSSNTICEGSAKSKTDWHTYFVFAEGRGGKSTLWSSSASCDSSFNPIWTSTYKYYCGYWAFDVTDTAGISAKTSTPVFKWRIGGSSALTETQGTHLAQPWSKMYINRVRVNNQEKWVGFIGGGYSGTSCSTATGKACDADEAPGKGFYVIDMETGGILWSATENSTTLDLMNHDLAAPVAAIDRDGDGFRDVAYVGDRGGNVWRFKFCTKSQDVDPINDPCTTADWEATLLFEGPSVIRPIYTAVEVAKDDNGQYWVYFGTGDKTEPTASNTQERFYAIKEDFTSTVADGTITLLQADGTDSYTPTENKPNGYYIQFGGSSEKILGDPVVYDGVAYFTSYIPNDPSDPCDQTGTSYIYAVDYKTGAGLFDDDAKGEELGGGLATGVIISNGKVYVSKSTGTPHTMVVPPVPGSSTGKNSLIYWLDKRVQ